MGTLAATLETRGFFPTSLSLTIPGILSKVMSPCKRDFLESGCLLKGLSGTVKEGECGNQLGIAIYGCVKCGELF